MTNESWLQSVVRSWLILLRSINLLYEPTIIRSNYCRCTRADPVPVDGGIPLVEFHAAGGGEDGQQVKFFFVGKVVKYFL